MGVSSAPRKREKQQAGRPFPVEKRKLRQLDSAATGTKKEVDAGVLPPIKKQKLQHSEKHGRQVIEVVPCFVSQSIPHPDNVKKAEGVVHTKTFCQNSEKQLPAPVANIKNCPAATAYQPPTPFTLNKPEKADGFERLRQILEPNRVPIYLLAGSRIVNQILGRDPNNQFTRAAFESEGLDSHPLAQGFQRTGCPPAACSSVPVDEDPYLFERTFALGDLLERMDFVHQQIVSMIEANPKANVRLLWRFIDAKVKICRQIKRQIAAAGAPSQEIPEYMIR